MIDVNLSRISWFEVKCYKFHGILWNSMAMWKMVSYKKLYMKQEIIVIQKKSQVLNQARCRDILAVLIVGLLLIGKRIHTFLLILQAERGME